MFSLLTTTHAAENRLGGVGVGGGGGGWGWGGVGVGGVGGGGGARGPLLAHGRLVIVRPVCGH